jgi:hypothetical protein
MTRPYMRLSIAELESMEPCPELIAELGYRTVPRARKLLATLQVSTATIHKMPAKAVPAPVEERKAVAKGKLRPKAVASVRASVGHPGTIAASWQDCTAEQLAWWRDRYSWHSTLFISTWPARSPAEMHDVVLRADKWAKRTGRKPLPVGRTVEESWGEEGLAYVLPCKIVQRSDVNGPGYSWTYAAPDWSHTPNREVVSRVAETDHHHFGAISRHILREIEIRDAPPAEEELAIAA